MATKLLLVEDSLSIQTIVETTFVQEDFEVIVSSDALDGLHKAQTLLPDIVLVDASMPGMDGFQLCQRLRQSASGHQVPVVLLTSGFAMYDKARGDHVGVTAHLAKPFDPQVLLALVTQLVPVARPPASSSAAVATIQPDTGVDPGEAADARAQASETNGAYSATRLSLERAETGAVPLHRESEMAVERRGEAWSEAMSPADTTASSLPQQPPGGRNNDVSSEAAQAIPHAMPSAGSEILSLNALYHTLGYHLVQMLRETLDAHVAMTLTQLMPQVLETVRDVVRAHMPDLLTVLLQQEIDKLKQAVEQDQREA
jgi:DNA-binding response OmpR family regulator